MSTRQFITTKQAKHQVNIFGFPLILYILLNLLLWNGTGIIYRFFPDSLLGIDPEILCMGAGCVLILLITFRSVGMAILLMNSLEWLPVYFGILRSGAVAVPLNYRYTAEEIRYCLEKAEDSPVLRHGGLSSCIPRSCIMRISGVLLRERSMRGRQSISVSPD